jgi:DNA-directed RNA polymerase subunit RPC12/RpoP
MSGEYTCAACGKTYISLKPEETLEREFAERIGREPREDDVKICDDCYKLLLEINNE